MIFLKGLLFGLVLQISVGPVCLAVLHLSISKGFREAFKMAWGVTLVDGFYIIASFLGVANLLNIYGLRKAVLVAGACTLIFFGVKHLIKHTGGSANPEISNKNSFMYGIKLTLTNPLTIIFWTGTFGLLISSGTITGLLNVFIYSLGCVTSTILFLSVVSLGGSFASRLLSSRVIRLTDYLVGFFLIYFGGSLLFK